LAANKQSKMMRSDLLRYDTKKQRLSAISGYYLFAAFVPNSVMLAINPVEYYKVIKCNKKEIIIDKVEIEKRQYPEIEKVFMIKKYVAKEKIMFGRSISDAYSKIIRKTHPRNYYEYEQISKLEECDIAWTILYPEDDGALCCVSKDHMAIAYFTPKNSL
jgi:hypothetical protein